MGQYREKIRDLSATDQATRLALDSVHYGNLDYITAMEALALAKHQEVISLRERLMEKMHSEGPAPITMPLDEFCEHYCVLCREGEHG